MNSQNIKLLEFTCLFSEPSNASRVRESGEGLVEHKNAEYLSTFRVSNEKFLEILFTLLELHKNFNYKHPGISEMASNRLTSVSQKPVVYSIFSSQSEFFAKLS